MIAGRLLEHGGSLVRANQAEAATYRTNLARTLAGLSHHFPPGHQSQVYWNTPAGGFFLVVTVPFTADDGCLLDSARDFGVLWTPMRHFHDSPAAERQIRLAYSAADPGQIDEGLRRFAALVADRCAR